MANILAIDTSTDTCSVSIGKENEVFSFHENIPRQHTEKLFSIIADLLEESKLSYEELDAVAVGTGPGSYTGIRLSCAVAQGILFSQSIKGISLSSLELLSIEANKESPSSTFVAISQENLGNVYIAESSFSDGDIKSKFGLISSDLFKREGFPEDCHFVGEGCALFPEVINVLPGAIPKSKYLLEIAKKRLNKSELIEPEEILPVYLNDENSWKKIK